MAESKLHMRLFVIFLAIFYRLNFAQSVLRRSRSSRFWGMRIKLKLPVMTIAGK